MYKIKVSDVNKVKKHINRTWKSLSRDFSDVLNTVNDPKVRGISHTRPMVLIPETEDFDTAYNNIETYLTKKQMKSLRIETLNDNHCYTDPHAILYLPHSYVVPGGRFNEMYGWDSYFIILGLLKAENLTMAKNMALNLLYEIKHYGKMLNANRCYYLKRSQPPLISEAVLAIYNYERDKKWLANALPELEKFYAYWTAEPRLIKSLGLSRYYADSDKPLPDAEVGYHERVKHFFRNHRVYCYEVDRFYDAKTDELKPAFFRADRSVRESGFDLSNKFGPFGADINSFAPISLNAMLCRMEQNIAQIHKILGNTTKEKAWSKKMKERRDIINDFMWQPELGYYLDYNFHKKSNRLYNYATTFYPLLSDVANVEQAESVIKNLCGLESNGGIMSSTYVTGMQWDAPFGWAPHQFFTVRALAEYDAFDAARRVSNKFISMINDDFNRTGCIYEKYNVVKRTSDVIADIKYGYKSNAEGFGWTNAVYLHLLDYL